MIAVPATCPECYGTRYSLVEGDDSDCRPCLGTGEPTCIHPGCGRRAVAVLAVYPGGSLDLVCEEHVQDGCDAVGG